ncbi:Hypothetical predicted protein, partial [Paramuricea clavata]
TVGASPAAATTSNVKTTKEASGLFDEDDDKTSSFNSERSVVSSTASKAAPAVQAKRKTNQISLFNDNDDDDDNDGDDLFASIAPSKTLGSTKNKTTSKPESSTEAKTAEVSKPAPKRSTISLFDDDDDEDDEEEDMFSIKPSAKSKPSEVKPPAVKPSAKSSTPNLGLFASEEDPLFSGSKPKAVADEVDAVSNKADRKTTKQESPVLHVDDDDGLFAEPKPKDAVTPAVTEPAKKEVEKQSEDLFEADSDEKDEEDGVKPGRKILPGAVPMFGGVDIFAGQKPGKPTKAKPQGDSLFADDEDDLFASPPKPVPTVGPRAKPRKPAVEAPEPTSSSPLGGSKVPVQASPLVSPSNKNTNVGKLQKTLAFNPAAMLPGAAPPPKKLDQKPIIFNPATMLPGAVPPPRKQENSAEATFDKPASVTTLESSSRDRARVRGKRRPPTRQARQKAAKESMDDTSLFGSDLVTPPASHERLTGTKGGHTSLFSDSEDLFSSSSYKAPAKHNLESHTTQSRTSKFDPLFIHNSMSSDLPSFEDSIDGIPSDDIESKKDSLSTKAQGNENKTDSLFSNRQKDDLFSTSTESDSSFLPKSNIVQHGSAQKSKSLFDEKPKDDLFSLSTESESSIAPKRKVVPQNVPKPGKTTDKKANVDDLFNQSSESNISQMAKPNKKSEIDSIFDTKPKDDLFSPSESDISQKTKPKEDVSAKKTIKSKPDPVSDSKPIDDLFSQSTDSTISEKGKSKSQKSSANPLFDSPSKDDLFSQSTKPKEDISAKKKEKSTVDPLFDNKPKDDLFSQSVESNKSEQAKSDLSATKNQKPETDPLFDSKPKGDIFSKSVESDKSSSQKVAVIEDDDDEDEDDLFRPNSRPLFSPPPLDFDSEVSASGDFSTQSKSKAMSDDIFNDDDDIFAPKSNKKKDSENKTDKEKTKVDKKNDKEEIIQ